MQGPDFDLRCEQRGDAVVAAVRGRVDHTNAEAFRAAFWPALQRCSQPGERVILDLQQLDYISSAGLRILMLAARRAAELKGSLALAALQPVVREIFEITRFDRVLKLYDSVDAALATKPPAGA